MSEPAQILVVDDHREIREALAKYLSHHDFRVATADGAAAARRVLETSRIDLVVLDVMMPREDGLSLCRQLRAKGDLPIIMLTAMAEETDRVVGLELGADDYIAKPFSPRELLARVRAVLRRAQPDLAGERVFAQDLVLDVGARRATVAGRELELTGIEFDILVALVRRAGRVVPRGALLGEAGRGDVAVGERTVDVHISRLRKKIGDDPKNPQRIKTVRGIGYVLPREAP